MGAPAKFLFNDDFSDAASARAARAPSAAEVAAQLAEAEQKAYRNGFAAGQAEAQAETQRRAMQALERIAQSLDVVTTGLGRIEDKLELEAVEVALSTARKLSGALLAREPLAEVTALASEVFREVRNAPHLVIRAHDSLYDNAKSQIENLARNSGFEGRLIILAEPEIAPGDCTIEWADGGMVRERAAIEARIDELVNRYLAVGNEHGATDEPSGQARG